MNTDIESTLLYNFTAGVFIYSINNWLQQLFKKESKNINTINYLNWLIVWKTPCSNQFQNASSIFLLLVTYVQKESTLHVAAAQLKVNHSHLIMTSTAVIVSLYCSHCFVGRHNAHSITIQILYNYCPRRLLLRAKNLVDTAFRLRPTFDMWSPGHSRDMVTFFFAYVYSRFAIWSNNYHTFTHIRAKSISKSSGGVCQMYKIDRLSTSHV